MREKGVGFTQRGLHSCGKSSFFERDFSEKNVPISPMPIVTIKNKYQVVIPQRVREQVGVRIGTFWKRRLIRARLMEDSFRRRCIGRQGSRTSVAT